MTVSISFNFDCFLKTSPEVGTACHKGQTPLVHTFNLMIALP